MSTTLNLHSEIQLGDIKLKNRALMAPLTRARAVNHVPTELMAEYYAQRAGAGLIIAEATMVMEGTSAFVNEPGIYNQAQIDGWQKVTDAVHGKGGKIFLQLWHGGRASHPDLNGGRAAVAASPIAITDSEVHTPDGKKPYTVPRALETDEIPSIVAAFKQAAINAKAAGFDGVEVHGANGYLLDNFLRDGTNQRKDQYGGSIENRARLLFEVLEAVIEVWGSGKVGLRTSPLNSFNSMKDSDPVGLTTWLAEHLNQFDLAFWDLMRTDFFAQQSGEIMTPARTLYKGNLIGNMGYNQDEASTAIHQKHLDAVAFGVPFIANPDLVERFAANAALNEADPNTFYMGGAEGYTDYPTMN
ncbi:NADH:flavin oxidoreductase/NADH oxidase [Oleiphilus messinensis]|uniref:NADH:flavin oxidoreductase/NADH oxidase n=1 Tax=Oleiphilus messinensis TaxID=141451 RepID=A0A1Y0ID63_9GAMM|nr:alkene reductase [Oleiphilus messinensis]ARU58079.1 NADH:flavin oxidoreductase/NADH oxidase [Oleiphilus messinensis]